MKQVLVSVLIAAVVSGLVVQAYRLSDAGDDRGSMSAAGTSDAASVAPVAAGVAVQSAGSSLRYTDALVEDVWINGARTAGDDHRALTDADNSICFITKIEIKGIQSPEDSSSCVMQVDDFTGFWDLVATVEEGGQSEIRCNARCLVWE